MTKYMYIDKDENSKDPFASTEEDASDEFAALLNEEGRIPSARRYRVGESVTGKVISVGAEFAFVDLGVKSAASIAIDEFVSAGLSIPKAGDTLSAYVRTDNGSEILLTRALKRGDADDALLREAFSSQLPLEAKVEKVVKGGFEVLIGSKRGFVPLAHMDTVKIEQPEVYLNQVFSFQIIEMKARNLVLSRRALLKEEQETKAAQRRASLEVGQNHRATITRLADFGAFASLDGVEGLIPLSEMSLKRIKRADEVVKVSDVVDVKIIRIEHAPRFRMALSLKQGADDSLNEESRKILEQRKNAPSAAHAGASQNPAHTSIFAAAFQKARTHKNT